MKKHPKKLSVFGKAVWKYGIFRRHKYQNNEFIMLIYMLIMTSRQALDELCGKNRLKKIELFF